MSDQKPESAYCEVDMSEKPNVPPTASKPTRSSSSGDFDLDQIRQAVKGIRFGEVRMIIQDGVIVQIERVEKQRLR